MSKPTNCQQPHYCVCRDGEQECDLDKNRVKGVSVDPLTYANCVENVNNMRNILSHCVDCKTYNACNRWGKCMVEIPPEFLAPLPKDSNAAPLDVSKMSDKDLLDLCRCIVAPGTNVCFDQLYERFDNYRRVQSLFAKIQKRET